MDEIFAVVGKLYIEISRLQNYAEILQNKVKDLEDKLTVAEDANNKARKDK